MTDAIMGALTGNREKFAIGLGGWLGQEIGKSIRGNPEEDARRRAEQAEAQRRAEQEEAQRRAEREAKLRAEQEARAAELKRIAEERERQAEAAKERLLSELIRFDTSAQLALMRIDSSATLQIILDPDLKDTLNDPGRYGSKPAMTAVQARQAAAWRQLHCAGSLAGAALAALEKKGDYRQFEALSAGALKALDGQSPGVECPAATPIPNLDGLTMDLEELRGAEREILARAAVIAERMKQSRIRSYDVKTREINEQEEIVEQERNRKEVVALIRESVKLTSAPGSIPGNPNVLVGSPSGRKVASGIFGTHDSSKPDLEKRDPNAGAVGTNIKARDQVVAVSHNDQALGNNPGTQEAISEKAKFGFDTGVSDRGTFSKTEVKIPSVSEKPGLSDNKEYKTLLNDNRKLDSENRGLTSKLEALKKQRESASGEEKGNAEMEMVKVKEQLGRNEYQQSLNEKKMNMIVDASVDIPE
jgi:hypothetical protein